MSYQVINYNNNIDIDNLVPINYKKINVDLKQINEPIENIIIMEKDINKIELIKIIYQTKILIISYTSDNNNTNTNNNNTWFEILSQTTIQINKLNTKKYISFNDLIQKQITGIEYMGDIELYQDNNIINMNEGTHLYLIKLKDLTYTYLLLRTFFDNIYDVNINLTFQIYSSS